jgi:hypothetical protein
VAANQARLAELRMMGTSPDPVAFLHARINHLIDAIAAFAGPEGPRWAALTRLRFEQFIASELESADTATTRLQLAQGATMSPAQIRELARQTGTFGTHY